MSKAMEKLQEVAKVLSDDAQKVWSRSFNDKYVETDDVDKSSEHAWGALKHAGYKEDDKGIWVKFSETFNLEDVEIFSVGTHNGDAFNEQDLQHMEDSFKVLKNVLKPRINLGHDRSKWKDGLPALGWFTDLKKKGSKLVASFKDVPEVVYKAVKAGLYKRVSAEMFFNYKHKGKVYPRVISAVAFLGSDLPAVKNLQDLKAYFGDAFSDELYDQIKTFDINAEEGLIKISKEEDKQMTVTEKEFNDLKAKNAKLEETIKQKEKDTEARLKKQFEQNRDASVKTFSEFCEQAVKDKKLKPAERDSLLEDLQAGYSDDQGLAVSADKVMSLIKERPEIIDTKEDGKYKSKSKHYTDVQVEVDEKAEEYCEKHEGVDYGEAVQRVLDKDSDLAKRYAEETATH